MRAIILADIHSNLEAFQAVLEDARLQGGVDQLWFLGDLVGYGPDPSECIRLLRSYDHVAVAGNHDWAATGKLSTEGFNPYAAATAHWTSQKLTREDSEFLASLPLTVEVGDFTLVHGSLREPSWEYLLSREAALATFALMRTPCCLVGHSHVAFLCQELSPGACRFVGLAEDEPAPLPRGRLILNPGGVGQPRDQDPRASYAILDTEKAILVHRRVPYDVKATQSKMRQAGLPRPLIERLAHGW